MLKKTVSKPHIYLFCAGLFCFITASVLLTSFSGKFAQEAGTEAGLPDMEDTIDMSVSGVKPDLGANRVSSVRPENRAEAMWVIYVTGSVKNPGVYEIPAGSRVYQALDAAGGFTGDADREGVNLAAPLQDGTHIRFPGKNEKITPPGQPAAAKPLEPAPSAGGQKKLLAPVNLNACTAEELASLPGIGPKTAELILNYRKANGGFSRVEDLLLVKGVGPKKYDAIRSMVTIGVT